MATNDRPTKSYSFLSQASGAVDEAGGYSHRGFPSCNTANRCPKFRENRTPATGVSRQGLLSTPRRHAGHIVQSTSPPAKGYKRRAASESRLFRVIPAVRARVAGGAVAVTGNRRRGRNDVGVD